MPVSITPTITVLLGGAGKNRHASTASISRPPKWFMPQSFSKCSSLGITVSQPCTVVTLNFSQSSISSRSAVATPQEGCSAARYLSEDLLRSDTLPSLL